MEPNNSDFNPSPSPDPTPLPTHHSPTFNPQPISPPGNSHPNAQPPLTGPAAPATPPAQATPSGTAPPHHPGVVSSDFTPATPAPANDFSAPTAPTAPGQVVSGGFEPAAANPPQPNSPQPLFGPPAAAPTVAVFGGVDPSVAATPISKRRPLKPLLIGLAAVLVVGGGSAAAYFGVIAPNQPANVLKAAFINSLQQKQVSSSGTFSASGGGAAYKGTFSTAEDSTAKAVDAQLNLTVTGINFSVETRLVNQNLYVKVGDLSTIAGLANAYSPNIGGLVQSVSSDLSNKWIVFDSTLLDASAGVKCALNANWTLTSADVNLLESQYSKYPFTTIKSTSNDKVNGQAAEKFVLNIDNSKLASFGNGSLQNLSVVKAIQKCPGSTTSTTTPSAPTTNHGQTPLTVWVDKSNKRIVQIAASSNDKNSSVSGSTVVTLHYGNVSIAAPSNAESAIQVLTDIGNSAKANPALLNLLSGGSSSATGSSLLQ